MSLHIYNPPAPHADPVIGYIDQAAGQRCGLCLSCPRDWLLTCTSNSLLQFAQMVGKFRLKRVLSFFKTDPQQLCTWSADVLLNPNNPGPYVQGDFGHWYLYYGTLPAQLGNSKLLAWYIEADVRSFNTPNDVAAWGPNAMNPAAPLAGGHWTQPNFNCLGPNTFTDSNGTGGLGFPHTIDVRPLWA